MIYDGTDLTKIYSINTVPDGTDATKKEYALENTMYFDKQSRDRSTSVVVKSVYILDKGTATDLIKTPSKNIYTAANLVSVIKSKPVFSGKSNVSVTVKPSTAGEYTFANLFTITYGADNTGTLTKEEVTDLLGQLGLTADDKLAFYKNGVCYYNIPIKHFGDDGASLGDVKVKAMSDYTAAHLGRFGVLRNNWYHIQIQSISKIGDPTIPTPKPTDPDDPDVEEMDAIAFTINMLNWCKRTQSENL